MVDTKFTGRLQGDRNLKAWKRGACKAQNTICSEAINSCQSGRLAMLKKVGIESVTKQTASLSFQGVPGDQSEASKSKRVQITSKYPNRPVLEGSFSVTENWLCEEVPVNGNLSTMPLSTYQSSGERPGPSAERQRGAGGPR